MSDQEQAWKEVSVVCEGAKADELSEIMFGLGALSVTLVDAKDDPILEPRPGEERVWPTTVVVGLFEQGLDVRLLKKASDIGAAGHDNRRG